MLCGIHPAARFHAALRGRLLYRRHGGMDIKKEQFGLFASKLLWRHWLHVITTHRTPEKMSHNPTLIFKRNGNRVFRRAVFFGCATVALAACSSGVRKDKSDASNLDKKETAINMAPWMGPEGDAMLGTGARPSPQQGALTWTIALATVGDPLSGRDLLAQVRDKAGLPEARLEKRGAGYVIAYGRYRDPAMPEARADLQRVRSIVVDGELPFTQASLLAPASADSATKFDEFDLRTVKQRLGKENALYTLQVNAYGRADRGRPTADELKEFRSAAEDAVKKLRTDGDEAYYYHGPNMSLITIGVFGPTDYDERRPIVSDSPRLKAAREKFPNSLVNGMGVKIRAQGQAEGQLQRSQLVAIPDE